MGELRVGELRVGEWGSDGVGELSRVKRVERGDV